MRFLLIWTLALTLTLHGVSGQRRRNNYNDIDNQVRLMRLFNDKRFNLSICFQGPEMKLEERRNIGPTFPYKRGDTPIFHFDIGDEPFIDTLKPLIKGIYQMSDLVSGQREITQAFGEAFAACEDCG